MGTFFPENYFYLLKLVFSGSIFLGENYPEAIFLFPFLHGKYKMQQQLFSTEKFCRNFKIITRKHLHFINAAQLIKKSLSRIYYPADLPDISRIAFFKELDEMLFLKTIKCV